MKRIMKSIMLILLSAMMIAAGMPCLQIGTTAASGQKLWATVGDNNTHLKPSDYAKNLKKYNNGSLKEVRSWSGWAWKNDYATSRLDFYTLDKNIPQAELVPQDFISDSGKVIKKENITATYLSLASANTDSYPSDEYYFDIISHDRTRDLEAGELYEAWVEIYVPENTPAGIYRGKISVVSGIETLAEFSYKIEVIDLTLTDPEDWQTYLELWTYPYASNRYYSGKTDAEYFGFTTTNDTNPTSLYYVRLDKKYEAGLESQLELYHKAGGNSITVSIVEDPWNSRYPCACPSMIKWTKKTDGTFEYDYTDMDYWIELNMKHGIDRNINLYSLAGVGWGFVYFDEASGTVKCDAGGYPGAQRWKEISRDFLTDLIAHLEEKGWFDIACLNMDERQLDWAKAVVEVAQSVTNSEGKCLKVGDAVNDSKVASIYDSLADISIWEHTVSEDIAELAESRREKGLRTTIYTCGAGKMSMLNEPAEAAFAVYESYKKNTDGVMRWALDKFDYDPLHSTTHYIYAGDCYLIYPDEKDSAEMKAQSTPRFEKLCEGMRDLEKIRILREKYPDFADAADRLKESLDSSNKMATETARMKARVLSLSRAVLTFSQGQFTDVAEGEWYEKAVRFAVCDGLMVGMSDTEFAPNASMTRGMFVTVLARMSVGSSALNNNASSIFKDVPKGQWYTGAIVWATKSGLLSGVAPGMFAPNDKLTREQTATLLYRYAQRKKYDTEPRADLTGYKDYNKIDSYAKEALSWANAMGIVKGVSPDTLDPLGDCTRAQVAEMFRRFCSIIANQ